MTHLIPDGELIDAKSTVFAQGDYRAMFRVSVWLTEEGVHEHHDQQGVEHSAGFLTAYHRALRRSSDRDHHIEAFRELAFVGDGVVPLGLRQRILLSRTPLATQDCLVDLAEQLVINLSPPPPPSSLSCLLQSPLPPLVTGGMTRRPALSPSLLEKCLE